MLTDLVFAGLSSTAAALTTVLYDLGTHPEAQRRLFDELKAPHPDDSAESSFLGCIMKETFRLSPSFPSIFPRYVSSGAETAIPNLPTPLPVGTMVGCNLYVLGRSKEVWGDDADEWKPERWMADPEDADGKTEKQMLREYAAFGRGSRACKGKDIAWMILSEAVTGVRKCFLEITDEGY